MIPQKPNRPSVPGSGTGDGESPTEGEGGREDPTDGLPLRFAKTTLTSRTTYGWKRNVLPLQLT